MNKPTNMSRLAIASLAVFGVVALVASYTAAAQGRGDADFYIATDGSDGDPGTKEKPFATMGRARDAVRVLAKSDPKKDIRVIVRGGTYRLKEPVIFGPEDSGTDGRSITYAGYPDEQPVFSGGRAITGWKKGNGLTWTVELPDVKDGKFCFQELFVNSQRRPRARGPNDGFFRVDKAGPDNRTSFQFHAGDLRAFTNLSDVQVVFLHDWSVSRVAIREVDEAARTVSFKDPIGAKSDFFRISGFEPQPRYYVENAPELLDAPGEWYLDRTRGVLSYIPRPDEDMSRVEVVAPVLDQLLVVRSNSERGGTVRNLRFVGLAFEHAATPRFPAGYAESQAGFHEVRAEGSGRGRGRMPAAVVFDATVGCRFEHGRIAHVGATAISVQGKGERSAIVGNEIFDAGGNGVMIGEPSTAVEQLAKNNLVANNRIHHCGQLYHGCVGVWAGITEGTLVAHNEIHDLPYTGVSVGWMWNTTPTPCRANVVEHNHIHHVMQMLSDGGGIYTLGRQPGSVLRGNLIHDVPINAGRAESNGMFIDEGSSEILIEQNTIYIIARSPIRFHKAERDILRNNLLVTTAGTPTFRYNATDEKSMSYEGNITPDAGTWTPPEPNETTAGLEPPYRDRLSRR